MKTAMQELIEWYQKEHFVKTTFHIQLLNKFEELLEKEKEQISKAWDDGDYAYFYNKETGRDFENGEEYYKQTYNN
jgi:hypothetical protein